MKHGYIILVIVLALLALVPPASVIASLWQGAWQFDTAWWKTIYIIGGIELLVGFIVIVMIIDICRCVSDSKGLTHHIITRAKAQLEELVKSAKGES